MNNKLLKLLFLAFLFIGQSAYAVEPLSIKRIDPQAKEKAQIAFNKANNYAKQGNYTEALDYFKTSYEYESADGTAFNLGIAYEELKDYNNAIKWYKKAFEMGKIEGGVNLGLLYKNMSNYKNAITWYKRAYIEGSLNAIFNLALLYEEAFNDTPNAIIWYKKAIQKGDLDSYDNISLIYHDINKDDLTASAYYIATIDKSYTKKEIFDFLKDDWKIDEATIKKAYHLQKTLVPNPYYDKEFEEQTVKKKTGRR
ncbi:MAG: hypothetical protein COA44_09475 [Arcobacter sp.]|nr:MAG: hypothetical protein COA44_09475 [Arcobacter sp.]